MKIKSHLELIVSCLLIGQFEFDFICITIRTNKRQLKTHNNQMTQGADREWYQGYHIESVVPKTHPVVPVEYWGGDPGVPGAETLTDTEWYQGYRGVPTHRVSGTKD